MFNNLFSALSGLSQADNSGNNYQFPSPSSTPQQQGGNSAASQYTAQQANSNSMSDLMQTMFSLGGDNLSSYTTAPSNYAINPGSATPSTNPSGTGNGQFALPSTTSNSLNSITSQFNPFTVGAPTITPPAANNSSGNVNNIAAMQQGYTGYTGSTPTVAPPSTGQNPVGAGGGSMGVMPPPMSTYTGGTGMQTPTITGTAYGGTPTGISYGSNNQGLTGINFTNPGGNNNLATTTLANQLQFSIG